MLLGCAVEEKHNESVANQTPECKTSEDCTPDEPLVGAQYLCEEGKCIQESLGNPASMKCEEDGGTLEMKEDEQGNQYGVCTLPDGTECDEWAYYRGECPAEIVEGECTGEPVYLRAECCQKLLKCDFAKIAVYTSATAQCSCEPTDTQRQCAAVQCGIGKFSIFDPN
ncbi:DUF333 domain-containing protein, partial [Candidatus Woesearchaeota archaeon]|nr:DUF333 domain-containing protein [Candidatus Woesearchaeota archaeon]